MRLAARPVGAASTKVTLARRKIASSDISKVVFAGARAAGDDEHFFSQRLARGADLVLIEVDRQRRRTESALSKSMAPRATAWPFSQGRGRVRPGETRSRHQSRGIASATRFSAG